MNLATLQMLANQTIPDERMRARVMNAMVVLHDLTKGDTELSMNIVDSQREEMAMIGALLEIALNIEKRMN